MRKSEPTWPTLSRKGLFMGWDLPLSKEGYPLIKNQKLLLKSLGFI
ncbi:hypothetical protein [Aquiflexum balticum]|nr:hypothetical protein [Aquiflexum balticum]